MTTTSLLGQNPTVRSVDFELLNSDVSLVHDVTAPDPASAPKCLEIHVELDDGSPDRRVVSPFAIRSEDQLRLATAPWIWPNDAEYDHDADPELGGRPGMTVPSTISQVMSYISELREKQLAEFPQLAATEREVQTHRDEYFDGPRKGLIPTLVCKDIEATGPTVIRYGHDKRLWRRDTSGVMTPDGEAYVRTAATNLIGLNVKPANVNEVVQTFQNLEAANPMEVQPDRELVYTPQGAVNWRTGTFQPHSDPRLPISTVQITAQYMPGADCPAFKKFIGEVLPWDGAEDFIFEVIGYFLLPENAMHKAFLFTGPGRNGKSTLLKVLIRLLGERNVSGVSLHALEDRFSKALLYGKLANICGDIDSKTLKSTSIFKQITGDDMISAEFKGKDMFTFTFFGKLAFSANRPPAAQDASHAYFSRLVLIPFGRIFTDDEQDKNLTRKLTTQEELSGILNEALVGLRRLMERGSFLEPEPVRLLNRNYREEADTVMAFIKTRLRSDPDQSVSKDDVFKAYSTWCRDEQVAPRSRPDFYDGIRGEFPSSYMTTRRINGIGLETLGLDDDDPRQGWNPKPS